ncbi:MAG TPA: hypothetical protein VKR06_46180 [Ktedonosporobacter sp.]|nr:hypothetical protein [Ktedonosporobacter sp.]
MKAEVQRASTVWVIATMLLLLFMLIGFDLYPFITSNDDLVIEQQAWLQVARDEYLAKDTLILAYRPATYHSQAVSDLQTILPGLQQTQNGLLKGDASLGLPDNPSDEVKQLLQRAQSDYVPLVTALKVILAHPDGPVDPIQINIVMMHEYPYSITMAQLAILIQQQAEATNLHILIIKIVIKTLLILVIAGHYLIIGRKVLDKLAVLDSQASSP